MSAVPNITEFSNSINPTDVVGRLMSPALVKKVCMMNNMHTENLPVGTLAQKFPKAGYLTATNPQAESTALAIGSGGELTDTSITATAAKAAVVSGLSVEQQKQGSINLRRIADEQAGSLARAIDNDALSMFGGFSTVVTAVSTLTVNDIYLAQYSIFASEVPNKEVNLAVVLHHRGHLNIKQELNTTGAAAYENMEFLNILMSKPQPNCYVGGLPGFDIYATSGHGTSGGDTQCGVFHPQWALAGIFDAAPEVNIIFKGSEGFYTEVSSYYLYDIIEWNDLAGVCLQSDT